MGYRFLFITLGGQHAMGYAFSELLQDMAVCQEHAYIELQRREWAPGRDFPTRSHHLFSGVPYHQLVGDEYGGARLGAQFQETHAEEKVV